MHDGRVDALTVGVALFELVGEAFVEGEDGVLGCAVWRWEVSVLIGFG